MTFTVNARDLDPDNDSAVTVRYTLTRTVTYDTSTEGGRDPDPRPPVLVPPYDSGTDGDDDPSVDSANPAETKATGTHIGIVVFSDPDARVTSVSVDAADHQSAPSNGSVGTSATVTVLDQYGRPMADQGIVLISSGEAITSSRPRFTGSNGQVRIGYSYIGDAAVETLTAIWDGDMANPDDDTDDTVPPGSGEGQKDDTSCSDAANDESGKDICGRTTVFWVGVVTDEDSANTTTNTTDQEIEGPADVLSHGADNQQIVIDGDSDPDGTTLEPVSMSYDSNDFFSVRDAATDATAWTPVGMAEFTETLDEALAAYQAAVDDTTDTGETEPTLVWSGYKFDGSSSATWFRLTSSITANETDVDVP